MYRLTAQDGGGIRGKSSLLILEKIMEQIKKSKGLPEVPRPCEYFDLIGGTSTGGIIAIMIGRLGMTVDECIRAYDDVGQAAFTPKRKLLPIARPKGAFSAKALEAAIKKVVKDNCTECATQRSQGRPTDNTQCLHEDLKLRNTACKKTVVLAITKANVDARPTLFTTYGTSMAFQDCAIWEVARATSAATTFFKSIKLGRDKIEFIDAGFGCNNPCEVLIDEAREQFPDRKQLLILSIGTGLGDVVDIKDSRVAIVKSLAKMAATSTAVADRLVDKYGDGGVYTRFNVEQGLKDITLSDWQKASTIAAHTENYLKGNKRAIKNFVDSLLFGPRRQQSDEPQLPGSSSIHALYTIPFLQNMRFTGREKVLETLQRKLFHSQDCRTLAIVGLGGVGKTQVVLQFAYWVKQNQPEYSIFWVPAYAEESFEKAYLDIAKKFGIAIDSNKEDPKITVQNHLSSECTNRWLLIIDNADDHKTISGPSSIYDYLPRSDNGLTVFTTRSSALAQSVAGGDQIELNKMDAQEAQRLLMSSVVRKQLLQDETLTMELLEELTYLPLAITQAAAYLNQILKHHPSPIKKYLELLRSTEDDLVQLMSAKFYDNTRYQDAQNAVATTWLVSFDEIRENHPGAADLLSFISCIEPKAIPRSLLPKLESEEAMERAIGTLSGYAFLESREVDNMYDMHSLVHLATRIWIQKKGRTEETTVNAVKNFHANFSSAYPNESQVWQIYFPHAFRLLDRTGARRTQERYQLLFQVGRCLCEDRRFRKAVRYLEMATTWSRVCLLENDKYRLAIDQALASAYLNNRQIKEAISMFEHIVKIQKTTLDEKDPLRLSLEQGLASAYLNNRQIKEAINILEHIVKIKNTTLDEKDRSRLTSEHELARAYLDDGRIKEAIGMSEHVVKIQKTTLDEKDLFRLTSEHELARAYLKDGRIKEAISMFEHTVNIQKATLNRKDYFRLMSEYTLAEAYLQNGRIKKGIRILERVVRRQKATLDEKDHFRLTSEHELARAYYSNAQSQMAIDLLEHVVMVESQLDNYNDAERQTTLGLLRDAREQLKAEQETREAEQETQEAESYASRLRRLLARKRVSGDDH
ncbi:acyl transferase/acyl hydrolase/lysophospholipase [Xylaria cubensis]|nr:acyl transferase/acyl hydrolase/lysophospholipase [Xylaria cubensis]